jgi:predicted transposase YdaD
MAIKDAPTVNILAFDEKEAYDHDRPISSLIRTQLLHLHTAENLVVPAKNRTNININHLLTERQASEYIQQVTARLHKYGKAKAGGRSEARKTQTPKPAKTSARKATSRPQKTKPGAKKSASRK